MSTDTALNAAQSVNPWPSRTGRPADLAAPIPLRAGPLSVLFEAGELRGFCVTTPTGEVEVLRKVYAAVRDRNWGTIVPRFEALSIDDRADAFTVTFIAHCDRREGDEQIAFSWKGTIEGTADGRISFSFDGTAHSDFLRNRIGFCVLHAAACAGLAAEVEHVDGTVETALFPKLIDPDQPVGAFHDLRAMSHSPAAGLKVDVRMTGDAFETEDQRNWTDGSFKTFCTPLARPFPVEIKAGTTVSQSVSIAATGASATKISATPRAVYPAALHLKLGADTGRALPPIGTGLASHGRPLTAQELTRLQPLRLAHLRVDWKAAVPQSDKDLRRAAHEAQALNTALELALFVDPADGAALKRVADFLETERPLLARILVYTQREHYKGGAPTKESVALVRQTLGSKLGRTPVAAGTDADFIFFGRNRPPMTLLDGVCVAANPQIHAFDDLSLVETLEAQAAVIATAAHHAEGKPVFASPITLKPRYNAYATAPPPPVPAGTLPPQVDPRQRTLFAAGWTLGCVGSIAHAGAAAITLFETTGWRGVMESSQGSALPKLFPSASGEIFPLYHVLADLADAAKADGTLVTVENSDRLAGSAVALQESARRVLFVANHSPRPLAVTIEGLAATGATVPVRYLDDGSVLEAAESPETFRLRPPRMAAVTNGAVTITLAPFALATVG